MTPQAGRGRRCELATVPGRPKSVWHHLAKWPIGQVLIDDSLRCLTEADSSEWSRETPRRIMGAKDVHTLMQKDRLTPAKSLFLGVQINRYRELHRDQLAPAPDHELGVLAGLQEVEFGLQGAD